MIRAARFVSYLSYLALATALPASAEVFTVTKTADTLDLVCDDDCSLREAVAAANVSPDPDRVIVLPAGVYALHRVGAGEDGNETGDLDVLKPILLVGAGADSTVIDAVASDRVFDLWASADLFGVMIRNGQVDGGGGGLLARDRAARVEVRLHRTSVQSNRAGGDGGGFLGEDQARLQMSDSTVLYNEAGRDGGGLSGGYISLANVTVSSNLAFGSGGGLFLPDGGPSILSGVTITQNQAESGGGLSAGPTARFTGSIVAGNAASSNEDCSGARSGGYNVIGVPGNCAVSPSDRAGGGPGARLEPRLGPLALIGPLLGHPLLPGSPALGLVPAESCEAADQVGQARPLPCDAGALEHVETSPACIPGGSTLCLQEGRFRVTASWTQESGLSGAAWAVPLTGDTGVYWFFGPENLELTVKVLDGCALNDSWWVFSTGLTNVGVTLTVEDLAAASSSYRVRTYTHPAGSTYAPRLDTSAFATCAEETVLQGVSSARAGFPVLVPTRTADNTVGPCDHDCSLRDAVAAANARQGLDVIVLEPGTYTLGPQGAGENLAATGDLDITDHLLVLGAGADRTVIDGGGDDRVLDVIGFVQSSLEIHGVTIRNGHADSDGGGIRSAGAVLLKGCHVTGNRAARDGGGVFGFTLLARDTTISDNEAVNGGGANVYGFVELTNVTVSGNRATQMAGGLRLFSSSTRIAHTTITGNSATDVGGIFRLTDETCPFVCEEYSMTHSVVAGNSGGNAPDCAIEAPFTSDGGYNVFGVAEDCNAGNTDRAGTRHNPLDSRLTPLMNLGGPTPTHGLEGGSPALDVGGSGCLALDQRGRPRPQDGDRNGTVACDAGAFELGRLCEEGGNALCLSGDGGDRFRVTAHWSTPQGTQGAGQPHPLTRDTGSFWFFDPANLELTLKVLDGCTVNDRFWVFLSGLTDVVVRIDVQDIVTGVTKTYTHDGKGPFATRLDTDAFACGEIR